MRQRIGCPCRGWEWREITLQSGLGALERYCPRCKRRMLIVLRGPDLIGVVSLDDMPLEDALWKLRRLQKWETETLLSVAREMAS